MQSSGKRALAEFDEQLAALRQRIAVPLRPEEQQKATTTSVAPSSTSTGNNTSTTRGLSMLYAGNYAAQQQPYQLPLSSSSACAVDPTAMQETIRYLKRASRDRLEEFADMEAVFHYDAEEEERRMTERRIAQGGTLQWDAPTNEPFAFEYDDQHHQQQPSPAHGGVPSTTSRGSTPQPQSIVSPTTPTVPPSSSSAASTRQRLSGSASSEAFDMLYDPKRALGSSSKPMGGTVVPPSVGVSATKTKPSTMPQSAFASRIPTRGGAPFGSNTKGGRREGAVDVVPSGLSSVGTAVPYSSVSVKAHVQKGIVAASANTQIVGDDRAMQLVAMGSGNDVGCSMVLRRFRPSCTAQLVDAVTVRFCPSCAHCMAVSPAAPLPAVCGRCGASMQSTQRIDVAAALSAADGTDSAVREIEEMEQREALAFQAALAEWRGAAAADTIEQPRATASSTYESIGGSAVASLARCLPRGHTYFSHLWLQMQEGSVTPS